MQVCLELTKQKKKFCLCLPPSTSLQELKIILCKKFELNHLTSEIFFSIPYSSEVLLLTKTLRQLPFGEDKKLYVDFRSYEEEPRKDLAIPGLSIVAHCRAQRCPRFQRPVVLLLGKGEYNSAALKKSIKCLYCPDRCFDTNPPMNITDVKLVRCRARRGKENFDDSGKLRDSILAPGGFGFSVGGYNIKQ